MNSSNEDQKFGLLLQETVTFVEQLDAFGALDVRGLTTLALLTDDAERIARRSKVVRQVQQELRDVTGKGQGELSVSMPGNFKPVIGYRATCVRVGQAIFGNHLGPNAYWPGIK